MDRKKAITPPRPNKGIDVEKLSVEIGELYGQTQSEINQLSVDVFKLCNGIRTETEAVVTKRERDQTAILIEAIKKIRRKSGLSWHDIFQICDLSIAAYESNDAGGRKMDEPKIDIEKKIDDIFLVWETKPWTSHGKDCPSVVDLKNDLKDFYHEMAMVCFNAGFEDAGERKHG
jgi:hypothetical protein